MYSLNSGDVSYIVPMDHVDLAFLRRNQRIGEDLKPLWTPRQEDYAEFQLNAWRRGPTPMSDCSDEEPESNIITVTCHICDTTVPANYLREHYNSKKHKYYLEIIDIALSRVRNNINVDNPIIPTVEPSKSSYFCDTCNITVLKKSKEMHEKSEIHKKSTEHDNILEKFLTVLTKGFIDNNDAMECNMNGENNSMPEKQVNKVLTPLEQAKEYIKAITYKMTSKSMEIEVLDENYIVLKVKGKCFKVPMDHFNGFVKSDKGMECLLCHAVVRSKSDHMWTGPHMRWVIFHLPDDHGVRQINQYYSHCIICNEMVRHADRHKSLCSNHSDKLNNALYTNKKSDKTAVMQIENPKVNKNSPEISGENFEKEPENDGCYSDKLNNALCNPPSNATCQQTNKKSDETAVMQIENPKVDKNSSEISGENIEKNPENYETKYDHYLITQIENTNGVRCKICLCVIPNIKINIEEHLNGKNHMKIYNNLLSTNKINKVKNGFCCDFCYTHLSDMTELLYHISSEFHNMYMKGDMKCTTAQTYCEPCMVYIDSHNFESHLIGRKHNQNASRQATTANDIKIGKESKTTEIKSTNRTPNEIIHVQHKTNSVEQVKNIGQPSTSGVKKQVQVTEMKNLQQHSLIPAIDLKSSATDKTISDKHFQPLPSQMKSAEPNLKVKLHHHLKETSNPKQLLCRVCDVLVPNGIDNIAIHTNGNNHKINYKKFLDSNNVKQVELNFHCYKCNVPITNKNEIEHIFGYRHKQNTNSDADDGSTISATSEQCNSDQKVLIGKYIEYKAKLYLFEQTFKPHEVYCNVCHVNVIRNIDSIVNHVNEFSHITKYQELLKLSQIVELDDGFFCAICNENIASRNELRHIKSSNHELVLRDLPKDDVSNDDEFCKVYCLFCTKFVPETDEINHNISVAHARCVDKMSEGALETYYYEETKKSYLKCKLCKCRVNNDFICATEHIEGISHVTAYKKLLDSNKICKFGNKMLCLACKIYVNDGEALLHIWRGQHSSHLSRMK